MARTPPQGTEEGMRFSLMLGAKKQRRLFRHPFPPPLFSNFLPAVSFVVSLTCPVAREPLRCRVRQDSSEVS